MYRTGNLTIQQPGKAGINIKQTHENILKLNITDTFSGEVT